jgi:hypothetical protein
LGFAEKTGPCATDAINAIKTFGVANCNTRVELGMNFICNYLIEMFIANRKNRLINRC